MLVNPPAPGRIAEEYPEDLYWHRPDTGVSLIAKLEKIYRESIFTTEIRKTKRFIGGGKMLDVGCGNGYVASLYRKHGFTVKGIDISGYAVDIARSFYNIDCIQAGFSAELFRKNEFDFVNMDYFLEHVPDPMKALADANSVLKTGGLLRLVIPNAESLQFNIFGRKWFNIEAPRHFHIFTPGLIMEILRVNGFSTIHKDHYSIKTNPPICASSFSTHLNPHMMVNAGYLNKLVFLILTWCCYPLTLLEGTLKKGATVTVFARKIS